MCLPGGATRLLLQNRSQPVEIRTDGVHVSLELLIRHARQLKKREQNFTTGAVAYDAHRIVNCSSRQLDVVVSTKLIGRSEANRHQTKCGLGNPGGTLRFY